MKAAWILCMSTLVTMSCKPSKKHVADGAASEVEASRNRPYGGGTGAYLPPRTSRTFNVMGPLVVDDLTAFDKDLEAAQASGVQAVTLDLWWGRFQPQLGTIDWSQYTEAAAHVIKKGFKFVPILSFHRCGGNVGDVCAVPLPSWVWGELARQAGGGLTAEDMKYKGENGEINEDAVPVWARRWSLPLYQTAMNSFRSEFIDQLARKLGTDRAGALAWIPEINISLGPSGELRYPSYDDTSADQQRRYPSRGNFMGYSQLAAKDYAAWSGAKGVTNAKVPERDALAKLLEEAAQGRVSEEAARLFAWYHESLTEHGRGVLAAAFRTFSGPEHKATDIGAKIPGIHWRIGWSDRAQPTLHYMDRFAELMAGVIPLAPATGIDCDPRRDGCGYRGTLQMFRAVAGADSGRFVLHFTAVEMDDCDSNCYGTNHKPKTLVKWVGDEAKTAGVRLKGENALAGSLGDQRAFRLMRRALDECNYEGITLLRLSDLGRGGVTEEFAQLIRTYTQ